MERAKSAISNIRWEPLAVKTRFHGKRQDQRFNNYKINKITKIQKDVLTKGNARKLSKPSGMQVSTTNAVSA
jgi:hypothetical protein